MEENAGNIFSSSDAWSAKTYGQTFCNPAKCCNTNKTIIIIIITIIIIISISISIIITGKVQKRL